MCLIVHLTPLSETPVQTRFENRTDLVRSDYSQDVVPKGETSVILRCSELPARTPCNTYPVFFQVKTTTRIRVVDMNTLTPEGDISKFDCVFSFAPRDIGTDPMSTSWGEVLECTGTDIGQRIKYVIPDIRRPSQTREPLASITA